MKKRMHLFMGICIIMIVLFYVLPFINNSIIPISSQKIKERNLDTGALIYSDSEEAVEGNYFLLKSKK